MLRPRAHEFRHGPSLVAAGLAQRVLERVPEILRDRVAIGMLAHVRAEALAELVRAQHVVDNSNHAGALGVTDRVKDLLHVLRFRDRDLHWVRRAQPIEGPCAIEVVGDVLVPQLPVGEQRVGRQRLHEGGKTLVQPQIVPPLHRH